MLPIEFMASMPFVGLLSKFLLLSVPIETGSSDSGESEKAEPTLEPEEEDLGAGLQEEDEDDILFWNVSIPSTLGLM